MYDSDSTRPSRDPRHGGLPTLSGRARVGHETRTPAAGRRRRGSPRVGPDSESDDGTVTVTESAAALAAGPGEAPLAA